MAYGFNLHTIHTGSDDRGNPIVQEAGRVFKYTETDYQDLLKLDAVREPTETELSLYFLSNPGDRPVAEGTGDGDEGEGENAPKASSRKAKGKNAADSGDALV